MEINCALYQDMEGRNILDPRLSASESLAGAPSLSNHPQYIHT
jgi:hypothetical protein